MLKIRRFFLPNSTSPSSSAASSPSSSAAPSILFPRNDINSIDTTTTTTNNINKRRNNNKGHKHFIGLLPKSSSSSSILEESARKKRDSWWNNTWNNYNNNCSDSNNNHRMTRHSMLPALRNGNGSNTSLATSSSQPFSPLSAGALRVDTNVHYNRSYNNSPLEYSNNNSSHQIMMNHNKYLTVNSVPSPMSNHSNDSSLDYNNNSNNNTNNNGNQNVISNHIKELSIQRQNEADEFIQKAIQYHEANELEKATYYFKLAADKDSPLGLFLYGIALRHGWGCKPNAKEAVKYLQRAAESAVSEINASMAANPSIARHELVLAIYELGVCFRHGWGVPKKKHTAVYYFEVAANLGDPDAQNDVAFCYYHGQGVKKDMKKAAKFYRMAAAQGAGAFGNSWIFKKKYDE